jgi:8-oxo-dGTP diphosphatase
LSDDRPTQVGIAVVRRADRFLVGQRPPGTVYAGFWEFPGGKCEPAEEPASAAERECLEETGLRVVVQRLRRTVTHRYPHGLVELHFYDCRAESATAEPAGESGYCWVGIQDLTALRFPEANELILDDLAREFTGPDSD